jgi:Family of unknown function (DUF6152)
MNRTLACVALCGLLMVPIAPLQAHHSVAGAYKLGEEAKVSGSFIAFRLTNPHSSLKLNVNSPDGSTIEWSFTGGSATQLARLGMGRTGPNALNSGDNITVTYVPASDGHSPLGLLVAITYPDGHTVRLRNNSDNN